jgi:DNA-binding MarR family transcriptional regulator
MEIRLAKASLQPSQLELKNFVPFRLNRLAEAVSQDLSSIYRQRFQLEIPEWRVLVTVGQTLHCTAQYIAASTRMHKTRVSRAVASLETRALIERDSNANDGRELPLRLSKAGRQVYTALVPQALAREREILSCLSDVERRQFEAVLTRLESSLGLNDT